LISSLLGPKAESGLDPCPDRERTTNSWLVGPIAQRYKKEVGATRARKPKFAVLLH